MILLSVPPQPPLTQLGSMGSIGPMGPMGPMGSLAPMGMGQLSQLSQLSQLGQLPTHPPGSVAMPPTTSPKLPRPRKVQRTKTQEAPSDLLWERLPFREIHFSTQEDYVAELKKFASEHDPKFEIRTGYTYTVDARVGNCTALHNSVAAGTLRLAFSVGTTLFFGNQCVKPNCKGDRQMKREQEQKKRGQNEDLEPDISKEIVYSSSEDASAVIFNCTPSHKEGRPGAVRPLSLLLWESVQGQAFWALVYVKARRGRTNPGDKTKAAK